MPVTVAGVPRLQTLTSFLRGALIGTAEIMPGISGGTIALVTGVYETIITSAGHFLSGTRALVTDRARARQEFARVRWAVIIPLVLAMIPAALFAARVLAPLVENHPVPMWALFLGMTAAALTVPLAMIGTRWRLWEVLLALAVAAAVFFLVGLPPQTLEPTTPVVFIAAAVAVCALVLPGTSGSFLLLTFGLYQPTLEALNERNLAYIATFILGAIAGLAAFIKALQWLLRHRRRITLVIITGVVAGALRALWPWQTEDRMLLAPTEELLPAVLMLALGAVIVLGLFYAGKRSGDSPDLHYAEQASTEHTGWRPDAAS